jgi:hypothetical protein
MEQRTRGVQEQVMTVIYDHVQGGQPGCLDAAALAQQLERPPAEVARWLRRCAREGLIVVEEILGQDNPSVVRLTILGRQWVERRRGT